MFKYTAAKQHLHTLRKIRRERYVRDKEYNFIRSLWPAMSYQVHCALWAHYDGIEFYSPTRVEFVPVQGYLVPVELFDCEEV